MGVTTSTRGYVPIKLHSLRVDSELNFDLYLIRSSDAEPVLYRHRDLCFTEDVRQRLIDNGVDTLLIASDQETSYYQYMEENIRDVLTDESISVEERTRILYGTSSNVLREFFHNPDVQDLVPRTQDLVRASVDFLIQERNAFTSFLEVAAFDYRTYTHSVNVSMYTLTLAQHAGHDNPAFLCDLGIGTFLHDIGKSRISRATLNKKGPLTSDEWTQMKKHPVWGRTILEQHDVDNEIILSVTLSHHEKLDGSGYPDGLKNGQLAEHVRMTTICDIFDALTTRRSYKDAMDTFAALDLMKREMKDQLDADLFKTFVHMMAS